MALEVVRGLPGLGVVSGHDVLSATGVRMTEITGEREIDVDAPVERVLEVLLDVAGYPRWQSDVKRADVLDRDDQGRPLVAEVVQDAKVRQVRVRVRYEHDEHGFSWRSEEGDVKRLEGAYLLDGAGPRTRVRYRLSVDPGGRLGLLLRGPIVDRVRDHVMDGTLVALRQYLGG